MTWARFGVASRRRRFATGDTRRRRRRHGRGRGRGRGGCRAALRRLRRRTQLGQQRLYVRNSNASVRADSGTCS